MSKRLPASERRAQLIEVGREVFAKHGFEATSMEEIADRAKVSKYQLLEYWREHVQAQDTAMAGEVRR
jgi:AcrR family transcriptional regulator